MKKALLYLIILLPFSVVNATNYYISSSGSDTNDGITMQTAWKSISNLNSEMNLLLPGDSVLFHCNDTLSGQIIVSKSGTTSNYIYFGSYGSSSKPVISGKTTISNWTQTSANIWSATCPDCNGSVTNFFINDVPQQIGRWPNVTDPNKGYRTYNSHSGLTQITDNTLSDAINWTGAEAVVRSNRFVIDRFTIKSQNKGTLQFPASLGSTFNDGYGYFIQNDPRTLDQQGEWYFNPSKKQFTIFSETNPNTFITKTTNCDNLINLSNMKYITIENLHFDGAGLLAINAYNCSNIIFRNNDITFSGADAVKSVNSGFITFENNLINKTNNNGLYITGSNHLTIRNNIIKNTALVAGMGLSGYDSYIAASAIYGKDYLIELNHIDSVGYIGVQFIGDTGMVRNNVISNFCMAKDDGGGIYMAEITGTLHYSRKLIGNIIYNGISVHEGIGGAETFVDGIYLDEESPNVDVLNNTIFNCDDFGINLHNANHINVKGNNVYNNGIQIHMTQDIGRSAITNCVVDSNNFVSKQANQAVMNIQVVYPGIPNLGSFDYNYYCRPFDVPYIITYDLFRNGLEGQTVKSWGLLYNKDLHSGESPIAVNPYTVNSVNSSNYITNGTFDSNTNGWHTWSNICKLSFASSSGVTGGALYAQYTTPSGTADEYMAFLSNNFALSADKTYRLKFAAKSNKAGVAIEASPMKNGAPYNGVADPKFFSIDTIYKQIEYVFTPYSNEPNSEILFKVTTGWHGDIWLDNVKLEEVDTTNTNPNKYIRFEYNATKNDKTISLTDTLVDVKGMPVSGNITLKPFTSIILFKKICSGIVPATPDTIKGDITVCPGTPVTYSITPVPGATYYTWKLPNGWTGTSTSYDITAIAGDTGGVISVMAKNVCDSSLVKTLNVTVNSGTKPAQPDAISGNNSICSATTNTYSIAAVSQATNYTWTLPDGWTGSSTIDSITATADAAGGNITVTANNGCGTSPAQTLSITTNPIPATPVITLNNGILQSNATNSNQWYVNNSIIKNATNVTYVPSLKGNYYVVVILNGCPSKSSNNIFVNPTEIDEIVDNNEISVHPNPTTGLIKITLNNNFNSDYIIDVYDNVGGLLQTLRKSKSEVSFDLDLGKYSAGIYLVRIYNSDKNYQFKEIKK